jgi:hypothetical protein
MTRKTIKLSQSEYNSLPFNVKNAIINQVKKEENRWFENKKSKLPEYKKVEVKKDKVGWYILVLKTLRP